jgi:uncharacterized membrane protein YbhN (UPF0104 family)
MNRDIHAIPTTETAPAHQAPQVHAGLPTDATNRPDDQAKRRRKWIAKGVRLAVAAAILAYLFIHIPLGDVAHALGAVRGGPMLAAIALALASQVVIAYRLKRLTDAHGLTLTVWQVFEVNLATLFYGLFLPGGNFSGIAVRFYKLSAAQQHFAGAAVALVIDRVAATAALCAVGLGFWCVAAPPDTWPIVIVMAAGLVIGVMVLVLMLTHVEAPILSPLERWAVKRGGKRLAKMHGAILDARALPGGTLPLVAALAVAAHLLGIGAYTCMGQALGLDLSYLMIGFPRAAIILATMIPISIAGLGLREGAAVAILAGYGVQGDAAVAFSLLAFGITFLLPGFLGGLFEAWRLWR